jgi:hypothetical protein
MPITTSITWVHSLWTAFAAVSTPSPIFGALSFLVGIIFLTIDPTERHKLETPVHGGSSKIRSPIARLTNWKLYSAGDGGE